MKTVVILVYAGLDRTHLEKVEDTEFDTVEDLLDALSGFGRGLYCDNSIQVWELSDFMDEWNNTDDDYQGLDVKVSFFGYAKVKHI